MTAAATATDSVAAEALARVAALHSRRPWDLSKDMVTFGQTEFPNLCDHCRVAWPCETQLAIGAPAPAPEPITAFDRAVSSRMHDLPIMWDGQPIEWRPWAECPTSMRFHVIDGCRKCGVINEPLISTGVLPVANAEGVARLADLTAFRCPDCGHDHVFQHSTEETWDLSPEDYTDAGSTIEGALW